MMKKTTAICLLATVALLTAGCTSTSQKTGQSSEPNADVTATHKLGSEVIQRKGVRVTAISIGNPYTNSDNKRRVSLTVRFCNDDKTTAEYSNLPWSLKTSDDEELQPAGTYYDDEGPVYGGGDSKLLAGDCTKGKVPFDVKKGVEISRAIYAPSVGDPVQWTIPKAAKSTKTTTTGQKEFLKAMNELMPGSNALPESQLLKVGNSLCNDLKNNGDTTALKSYLEESGGYSTEYVDGMVNASTKHLCPQYKDEQ